MDYQCNGGLFMEDLIEKIALEVTQTGTNKINFKILKMIDNDCGNIGDLMKLLGLAKVPINIRINELEKVGLVNRRRGTGSVSLTKFGKYFIKSIYSFQNNIISPRIMDMLEKITD
jgi:predicted transcriptional regulator